MFLKTNETQKVPKGGLSICVDVLVGEKMAFVFLFICDLRKWCGMRATAVVQFTLPANGANTDPGKKIHIQAAAVTADRADALLAIDDRVHALVRAHIGVKCRTFGHILHNIHSDQARLLVIGPAGC